MVKIESKDKSKTIKIGTSVNGRVNLVANFKCNQMADDLEKLSFVHILRIMKIDKNTYGIGATLKKGGYSLLMEAIPEILERYEH
jgi:hypothetical protein